MLTGAPAIDDDHRALFAKIRDGMTAENRTDPARRGAVFKSLLDDFADHFAHEEQLMAETGYPTIAAHAMHHAEFMKQLEQTAATIDSETTGLHAPLEALDTLFRDALNGDVEFAAWLEVVKLGTGKRR
jgi:hemerythrin-like metal-binding protein